jgi:hypothetical protein
MAHSTTATATHLLQLVQLDFVKILNVGRIVSADGLGRTVWPVREIPNFVHFHFLHDADARTRNITATCSLHLITASGRAAALRVAFISPLVLATLHLHWHAQKTIFVSNLASV